MQFVANMRGDVLGSIGLAFLVYTVITTIQKVEASFNFVWRVERPRSFARRFTEYLSVMILGPILLAVALGLLGTAEHSPFAQWLRRRRRRSAGLCEFVGQLVPYAIVTVVFTFMYVVHSQHPRASSRAALIGGVTAGIIWALVGQVFTAVHPVFVADGGGLHRLRHRADHADLGVLELAHPADRRAARLLRAVSAVSAPRPGGDRADRQRPRAGRPVDDVSDRPRLSRRQRATGRAGRLAAELDIPSIALAPVLASPGDAAA